MAYDDFKALQVRIDGGVATVTLSHPPLNLLDATLMPEIKRFVSTVRDDDTIHVIVFESAVPDFFIAHVDANYVTDAEGFVKLGEHDVDAKELLPVQHLGWSIRNLPQVSIAKLTGRLRGGGYEFALAFDMRFAARGETWMGLPEVRFGVFAGGGGSALLARMIGRARALEVILSGDLYDTEVAEKYGWINRAFPRAELDAYVDDLARRIAGLLPSQRKAAKASVDPLTGGGQLREDFGHELAALALTYPAPKAVTDRVIRALAGGLQTVESELDLEGALDKLDKLS